MRRIRSLALALAALAVAAPALAQRGSGQWLRVEVNPYAGAFVFDDSALESSGIEANIGSVLGGRLGLVVGDDWLFEGSYGRAGVTLEASEFTDFPESTFESDLVIHLLHASAGYLIGTDLAPTRLVLSVGAGGLWMDPDEGESDSDFMVDLGVGFTHPVNDWIAFKGDVKDHVTFCTPGEGTFTACDRDETLNHWELSGGLQLYLY